MAVTKGDQLLMGRSPHWRAGWYSVLAGFVEAGETLEACVKREVMEEVGIEVKNTELSDEEDQNFNWPSNPTKKVIFLFMHISCRV